MPQDSNLGWLLRVRSAYCFFCSLMLVRGLLLLKWASSAQGMSVRKDVISPHTGHLQYLFWNQLINISLVQPDSKASIFPITLPGPKPGDVDSCDVYYSFPNLPQHSDCRVAFNMLPNKNRPTPWYSDYYPGSGQNMLSLTRTHGQFLFSAVCRRWVWRISFLGTCQIQLDISGETVIRQNPAWIGRNKVRPMGSWVLFRCGLGNKSGMVAKYFKKALTMPLIRNRAYKDVLYDKC